MSRFSVGPSYEWSAECDVCRKKTKASLLKKRWDGFMVCNEDFEIRHPSDFYTPPNDVHLLPFTRPAEARTPYLALGTIINSNVANPVQGTDYTNSHLIQGTPNASFQNNYGPSLTIMAWVYTQWGSPIGRQVVFGNGVSGTNLTNQVSIAGNSAIANQKTDTLHYFQTTGGVITNFVCGANKSVPVGKWVHIAYTRDDTKSAQKLYVNGEFVAGDIITAYASLAPPLANNLFIGSNSAGASPVIGAIRDVRVFGGVSNRAALTQGEIRQNMQVSFLDGQGALLTPLPTPATYLIGWWKMNEGTGTTINDSSGVAFNFTISGGDYYWNSGVF